MNQICPSTAEPEIVALSIAGAGSALTPDAYRKGAYWLAGFLILLVPIYNLASGLPISFMASTPFWMWRAAPILFALAWLAGKGGFPRASTALACAGMIQATVAATYILSFLLHAFRFPLVDPFLHEFDRSLGFDWASFVRGVSSNGLFFNLFGLLYHSIKPQAPLVLIILAATRPLAESYRLVAVLILASIIGLAMATALPGIGMLEWEDRKAFPIFSFASATPAEMVHAMRAHAVASLDFGKATPGMLTFPSFHALYADKPGGECGHGGWRHRLRRPLRRRYHRRRRRLADRSVHCRTRLQAGCRDQSLSCK